MHSQQEENDVGDGPVRVVHLSDIHLHPKMLHATWKRTVQLVRQDKPHLLVVSGDFVQHPSPLSLALARREITELTRSIPDCELFVVPGNHDVAFAGSFRLPPFTWFFRRLFHSDSDRWLSRYMPTFTNFREKSWAKRQLLRIILYPLLLIQLLLISSGQRSAEPWRLPPNSKLRSRLWILGLDSNHSVFLAAGRVRDEELAHLGTAAADLVAGDSLGSSMVPRLLVVHHHPLPIPYAGESVTSFEPFLVLREAGTLLAQAAVNEVDLILHGHRHIRSLSKLDYVVRSNARRVLAVLAASSPTASDIKARDRSYNLVEVHCTGRISVRERFTDLSEEVLQRGVENPDDVLDAVNYHAQKLRFHHRLRSARLIECDELIREVRIHTFGRTDHRLLVRGLRAPMNTSQFTFRYPVRVGMGFIDRATIFLDADKSSPGVRLVDNEGGGTNSTVTLPTNTVILRATVPSAGTSETSDICIGYETLNSYQLSEWECRERKSEPIEFFAVPIRWPIRRLQVDVTLPDGQADVEPYLECHRLRKYPDLSIDRISAMVDFGTTEQELVFDAEAKGLEGPNLRRTSRATWRLQVDFPQVGYVYRICWRVQDSRERSVNSAIAGETLALRTLLLDRRRRLIAGEELSGSRFTQILHALLRQCWDEFSSNVRRMESVRLCLLTYDQQMLGDASVPAVVAVEEVVDGISLEAFPAEEYWLPLGEGAAGVAMKAADSHLYWALARTAPAPGGSPLFARAEAAGIKAVLAIPIYHPQVWDRMKRQNGSGNHDLTLPAWSDLPSVQETVGIVTFASDSPGSGLGSLYDPTVSEPNKRRRVRELQDVVHATAQALLAALKEGTHARRA